MARPTLSRTLSSAPPIACGLTPRSRGAPTARHQALATGTVYIVCGQGLASHRRRPLTSNVRPRGRRRGSLAMEAHRRKEGATLPSTQSKMKSLATFGVVASSARVCGVVCCFEYQSLAGGLQI